MQALIAALSSIGAVNHIPLQISIQLPSVLIWLTALITISLGFVVLIGNRSIVSKAFAILSLSTFTWMTSQGFFHAAASQQLASHLVKADYFFGGVLAAVFFYFALVFPKGTKPRKGTVTILVLSQLFLLAMYMFTNSIVYGAVFQGGYQRWGWSYGNLSFLFDIFFYIYWVGGTAVLFRKYLREPSGSSTKTQLKFMIIAMIIAITPTSLANILFPRLGYFSLDWFGVIAVLGYLMVMWYSIVRYNQMEVKAVASEALIIAMVIFLFANIFTSGSVFGVSGRIGIFIAFVIMGSYLIRSVLREVVQKEQLAVLNNRLEDNNLKLNEKTSELNKELAEIERMNKYMVNRELKMVELKRELEEVRAKLPK